MHLKTLAVLGILALLFSGLESLWWIANLFAEMRFPLGLALLAITGMALLRNRGRCATVSLIGAAVALGFVVPNLIPSARVKAPADDAPRLRVFSQNLSIHNPGVEPVAKRLLEEAPDLIFLFEVTPAFAETLEVLEGAYPYHLVEAREDEFGIACFSRLPLTTKVLKDFSGYNIPSILVTLDLAGETVTVLGSHPPPPSSSIGFRVRGWHLGDLADAIAGFGGPAMVVGDLNVTPWTLAFHRFRSAAGLRRIGLPFLPTWSPYRVGAIGLPIDHHLVSSHWDVAWIRRHPFAGSDHRGVLSEVALRRETPAG